MVDDPVRPELVHRNIGIAEGHCDGRDAGGLGGGYVVNRVAYHDGPSRVAASLVDRERQMARVRLEIGEAVAAADGGEAVRHAKALQELDRVLLVFVGADREAEARR